MIFGLLDLSLWQYVAATLIMTHITIVGVTVYLHRHQAHRALELHPVVSHFFRFWLWMSTGMGTKHWVAVHRKHHAKCETDEDPHSPQTRGLKKVMWEGAELYRTETKNLETLEKYGQGTPNDWIERNVYLPMHNKGIVLMLVVNLILFGIPGLTIWAIQMMWIPFWAAGIVNGVGHFWGYRNYECQDASRNVFPWGIIIGGEELHNNHHTYASSAKLSSKWWEFDIGWMYIRLLSMLGLAQVKRVAPTPVIIPSKSVLDLDTARAIATNRFQVMARYAQEVIARVNKEEVDKAPSADRSLLRKVRPLLVREESLINADAKRDLAAALLRNEKLNTVYEFKHRLQELWQRSSENQEGLVHQLQDWCKQAEATRIKALQDFARNLRTYAAQST